METRKDISKDGVSGVAKAPVQVPRPGTPAAEEARLDEE